MSLERHTGLNEQISQEAAEWLVEIRTGEVDSAGRRKFDAWLRASPEHIRAFIEMVAVWHEGGAIDPRRQLDVEEIIARAQGEQDIAGLMPFPVAHAARESVRSRRGRLSLWAVAAGLSVAVLAAALILDQDRPRPITFATDAGVRRSLLLPDGSTALLDSKSRLRVSYTSATRTVELLQGQALFSVVKNPRRPFLVEAGHTVVRDVGTVFDVNRLGDGAVVTVLEGRVAVRMPSAAADGGAIASLPDSGPVQPIYLTAGEQLDVHIGLPSTRPIHVDTRSETAWTHGQVVLESATLPEVAQVFNRYSARRLVAKDLGKEPLHLSGVFSTNPDFIVGYLRARPDVVMTETDSEIDIVRNPTRDAAH